MTPTSQGLLGQLGQLYGSGQGYPQQQVAGFSPDQLAAMGLTEQMTGQQQGYMNTAQGANQQLAAGQNPYVQAAQQANAGIAAGNNLDPSKNPALQQYLQAGMNPIISNYTNAVAPNILSNAITSGGLGSSGTQQAFNQAQQNLAQNLGTYTAGVIEPAYEAGLGQQMQAIGETTGLLQPQETAISQTPGLVSGAYTPTGQLMGVGTQQQQQGQNILNTIFGNQMAPYQMLGQAAGLLGPLAGGGSQNFTIGG